jgi:hypothetical protein
MISENRSQLWEADHGRKKTALREQRGAKVAASVKASGEVD